jgi:transmembrane sensor
MNLGGDRFSDRRRDADTQAAAEWFARRQTGSVDETAFARWRDADPAHALAFARVTAAWEAASEQAAVAVPVQVPVDDLTRRRLMRGGAAGAVLLAVGSGVVATRAYAWNSASTDIGETRRLRLPDGSMAMLNTDTALSWRFSDTKRELWLERGEVALDLQHGPDAELSTRATTASLAPGRFNARLRDKSLELIVLRGIAIAAKGAVQAEAQPYQRIAFAGTAPTVSGVTGEAVESVLAWQSGDIVFVDTPLAQAVAEYNRYLPRRIVIDDPSISETRIGGRFVSSDPGDFLHALSTSLGVRVHSSGGAIHLAK